MKELIGKKMRFEAIPKTVSVGADVTSDGRLFQNITTLSRASHL